MVSAGVSKMSTSEKDDKEDWQNIILTFNFNTTLPPAGHTEYTGCLELVSRYLGNF